MCIRDRVAADLHAVSLSSLAGLAADLDNVLAQSRGDAGEVEPIPVSYTHLKKFYRFYAGKWLSGSYNRIDRHEKAQILFMAFS